MNKTLRTITEGFRRKVARDMGLSEGTLRFDFGDDGCVYIDGRRQPNRVSNERKDADCVVFMALCALESMINGRLDGVRAVRERQVTVVGDLGIVMAFGPAEGDLPGESTPAQDNPLLLGNLRFPFEKGPHATKTSPPKKRRSRR